MEPNPTNQLVNNYIRERLRSFLKGVLTEAQIESVIEDLRGIVIQNYYSKIQEQLPNDDTTVGDWFSATELNGMMENSISEICDQVKIKFQNQ